MASKTSELACTYAALILHDEGVEITQDKIAAIVQAAGVQIEGYYPMLFAKYLAGKNLGSMLNVSAGAAPTPAAAAPSAPAAAGAAAPARHCTCVVLDHEALFCCSCIRSRFDRRFCIFDDQSINFAQSRTKVIDDTKQLQVAK